MMRALIRGVVWPLTSWYVDRHVALGRAIAKGYKSLIWKHLDLEWYDNRFNHLAFDDQPQGLERPVLSNLFAKPGMRVLDVGCGDGYGAGLLARQGCEVIGIDRDESALAYATRRLGANPRVRFVRLDLEREAALAGLTEPHDLACCYSVIQFLSEPALDRLLGFLRDRLRPDGCFLGSTTLDDTAHVESGRHRQAFRNADSLRELLAPYFADVSIIETEWSPGRVEGYFIARSPVTSQS